jgi:RNA polymerase sigma factor (sigma-70 family)
MQSGARILLVAMITLQNHSQTNSGRMGSTASAGHRQRRQHGAEAFDAACVVTAASAGDRTALSELVERFATRVRTVARMHRLAAHDVDDVMQTTWLRLLEHVGTIRDPNAVGAWLETTARRESLRLLRASGRECPTDNERVLDAPVAPVDERRLGDDERRAAVAAALEQMTGRRRELLSMLFAEDAPSYAEISRALSMPIGSIGPTRARCLAWLRENPALVHLDDTAGSPAVADACITRAPAASMFA